MCNGLSIDDVGVSTDTVFQEIRHRELVLKPAISLKKRRGGYCSKIRGHFFSFFFSVQRLGATP